MLEYNIGVLLGAFGTGLFIGLVFLLISLKFGERKIGIYGIVSCTIANFLLGLLLSIPIFLMFCAILALVKSSKTSKSKSV